MKEQVLLDYFKNKVSVKFLVDDLEGSRHNSGNTFPFVQSSFFPNT